jgi:hypothetical protein
MMTLHRFWGYGGWDDDNIFCLRVFSPIRLAYKGFLLGSKYTGSLSGGVRAPGSPRNRVLLTNPRLKCNRREIGILSRVPRALSWVPWAS